MSLFTGTLAAVDMVLQEFPAGIVIHLLLLRGGFRSRAALWYAPAAAAHLLPEAEHQR